MEKVHDTVITLLGNDQEEEEEDKWIAELSKRFYDLEMEVAEYLNNDEKVDANIVKTGGQWSIMHTSYTNNISRRLKVYNAHIIYKQYQQKIKGL